MVRITEEALTAMTEGVRRLDPQADDELHWRADLVGRIDGEPHLRSYHFGPAGSKDEAKRLAVEKFGHEWDQTPRVTTVERYRNWRMWESQPEGRLGMG
ncbi:hypothetical protein ACFFQW_35985 [Umezawaea endophytica]|uniref:Uncharacterized protein n=1 Tax=Umezawaea endophytica TaxID=1654476 RepID=A0A9X2VIZ0_9PSEU|nr:hypothetical protein [Umezawaea endophytica]MCS7477505.1 hypothetical protein [Umezawaea endophytica]